MSEGRGLDPDDDDATQALEVADVPTRALETPTGGAADAADAADAVGAVGAVGDDGSRAAEIARGAPTELLAAPGGGPLDDVFGAERFVETAGSVEGEPAIATRGARRRGDARRRSGILVGIAAALAVVLALAALFVVGTRLPQWFAAPAAVVTPSPTPTPTATPTPTPTPVPRPDGPVGAGTWAWNELGGGECLADYVDPWQLEFTVVDCAEPHPAQLTYRSTLPGEATAAYPGEKALAEQLPIACGSPEALNLEAAGAYSDVQVQASYPVTAAAWDAGERDYYCFVTRASGEPLTGSLAPTG